MKFRCAALGLSYFALVGPAFAHHSFAMFDAEKTITLEGTVKEFEYTNPHAWIYLMVRDAQGKVAEWGIEMGGLNALTRAGWKADTIAPGDKIVVQIHPLKDGSYGGQYLTAKLPDGRNVEGSDTGLPPAFR